MGALALLRGERYAANPGNEFSAEARPMGVAPAGGPSTGGMPQAQPEQPSQSNALALVPDNEEETMPQAMPTQAMGQPTAMTVASPEDQQPQYPEWFDDEQKKLYERGKRIRQNYQRAVDLRRQRRRADREYSKLYNSFEKNKEAHDRLEHFQKEYPDMFRPDDPRTLGMIRQQMMHLNEAKVTRDKLVKMLQQNGVKLGPKGQIPDSLYGDADDEDRKFDQFAKQGLMDAMFSRDDDY
ncbi:hypothetical protein [Nitrospira sp. BLG_1]|uniref:hypothetical protein n=1 Tax=Nitrospira sp. BLG_1 TaxID=3395883 RepID=UPI0039BD8162